MPNPPPPRLTVIGSSNIDFIMALPQLPAVGETVSDGKFMQTFGGKGANQAVAAARAGGDVTFLTCLGRDPYAPVMKQNFAGDGIDISFIQHDATQDSGTALVMFDGDGQNYLAVAPGSNYALTADHVASVAGCVAASAVVVLQNEITAEANRAALEAAAAAGVQVVFNYAPVRDQPLAVNATMGVLVVNETEAAELLGAEGVDTGNAEAAAEDLQRLGPERVVLTLGADGVVVREDDVSCRLPPYAVKAVDTTAAGDTFCGVLAVGLSEGMTLADAAALANAAAALSVTRPGAQPSIPQRNAIDTFVSETLAGRLP